MRPYLPNHLLHPGIEEAVEMAIVARLPSDFAYAGIGKSGCKGKNFLFSGTPEDYSVPSKDVLVLPLFLGFDQPWRQEEESSNISATGFLFSFRRASELARINGVGEENKVLPAARDCSADFLAL